MTRYDVIYNDDDEPDWDYSLDIMRRKPTVVPGRTTAAARTPSQDERMRTESILSELLLCETESSHSTSSYSSRSKKNRRHSSILSNLMMCGGGGTYVDHSSYTSSRCGRPRGRGGTPSYVSDETEDNQTVNATMSEVYPTVSYSRPAPSTRRKNEQRTKKPRKNRSRSPPPPTPPPESKEDMEELLQDMEDLKRWASSQRVGRSELRTYPKLRRSHKHQTHFKKVSFAHPVVTSLKYRPRTRSEERDQLFFDPYELEQLEMDREEMMLEEEVEVTHHPDQKERLRISVTHPENDDDLYESNEQKEPMRMAM